VIDICNFLQRVERQFSLACILISTAAKCFAKTTTVAILNNLLLFIYLFKFVNFCTSKIIDYHQLLQIFAQMQIWEWLIFSIDKIDVKFKKLLNSVIIVAVFESLKLNNEETVCTRIWWSINLGLCLKGNISMTLIWRFLLEK